MSTSRAKVDAIRSYGGDVRFFGSDGLDTELHARAYAREHGMFYVSPYNDPEVIAGQGTVALELLEQVPELQRVARHAAVAPAPPRASQDETAQRHGGARPHLPGLLQLPAHRQ